MQDLEVGSIILFGSTISIKRGGPCFALDTVFVVGERRVYKEETHQKDLAGFIPKYYDEIMGFSPHNTAQLVCYKGATFNSPVNGMYSFVPCKPLSANGQNGFRRVELRNQNLSSIPVINQRKKNPQYISDNLNSSPNITMSDLTHNKMVWDKICQIVDAQKCMRGVSFEYHII